MKGDWIAVGANELMWKGKDFCIVLSSQPGYIYTPGGLWTLFEGERWRLISFWPSLKARRPKYNEAIARVLLFKREK